MCKRHSHFTQLRSRYWTRTITGCSRGTSLCAYGSAINPDWWCTGTFNAVSWSEPRLWVHARYKPAAMTVQGCATLVAYFHRRWLTGVRNAARNRSSEAGLAFCGTTLASIRKQCLNLSSSVIPDILRTSATSRLRSPALDVASNAQFQSRNPIVGPLARMSSLPGHRAQPPRGSSAAD